MTNPMKTLPKEALYIIKSYYSDRFAPHPIAELIKDLDFRYEKQGVNTMGFLFPARLRVEGSYFIGIRFHDLFTSTMGGIFRNVLYGGRNYVLSDFTEPDRYQEASDRNSGIQMGKVL